MRSIQMISIRTAFISACFLIQPMTNATVITVGLGQDYPQIQDVVNAAQDGDIVLVLEVTFMPVNINSKGVSVVDDRGAGIKVGEIAVNNVIHDNLAEKGGGIHCEEATDDPWNNTWRAASTLFDSHAGADRDGAVEFVDIGSQMIIDNHPDSRCFAQGGGLTPGPSFGKSLKRFGRFGYHPVCRKRSSIKPT